VIVELTLGSSKTDLKLSGAIQIIPDILGGGVDNMSHKLFLLLEWFLAIKVLLESNIKLYKVLSTFSFHISKHER